MTNSSSGIIHLPLPQDDPVQRQPNIDLAKKELNWIPQIPLEDGLKKTIDYFESIM
jgi:UDP-glucuronate decarboxylase